MEARIIDLMEEWQGFFSPAVLNTVSQDQANQKQQFIWLRVQEARKSQTKGLYKAQKHCGMARKHTQGGKLREKIKPIHSFTRNPISAIMTLIHS